MHIKNIEKHINSELVYSTTGYNPDFDAAFRHPKHGAFTVEFKTEKGADDSGNIVVEIANTRTLKPTGIFGTKATH